MSNQICQNLSCQISRLSLENKPNSFNSKYGTRDEWQIHEILIAKNESDVLDAKERELDQWKKEGVYTEVTEQGQDCIIL